VSKPKLSVSVTPHRARAGRRTRFLFRVRAVSPSDGKARLVRGARLVFAGKHYRTGKLGGVRFFKRLRHAGRRTARASKPGYRRGSVRVRVLPARRARH
jgi:hypothetical protein